MSSIFVASRSKPRRSDGADSPSRRRHRLGAASDRRQLERLLAQRSPDASADLRPTGGPDHPLLGDLPARGVACRDEPGRAGDGQRADLELGVRPGGRASTGHADLAGCLLDRAEVDPVGRQPGGGRRAGPRARPRAGGWRPPRPSCSIVMASLQATGSAGSLDRRPGRRPVHRGGRPTPGPTGPRWPTGCGRRTLDDVVGQDHLLGAGRAAAGAHRGRPAVVGDPLGPAGHRQDHAGPPHRHGHGQGVRAALGGDAPR